LREDLSLLAELYGGQHVLTPLLHGARCSTCAGLVRFVIKTVVNPGLPRMLGSVIT
jgi:hypothetical protein